jgi:plasmid replication initiation protein
MFEMLSAYKDTGVWYVKTDNFRELMDCTKKYPNVNDFLKKTLAEPLQELEETEMAFTYNKIFKKRNGRGRPSLAALEFHLKKVQPKTIPAEWYEFSDEHKTVLQRLTNEFLIDEKHIVKYIYAIGLEKTNKMMYDWKLRIVNNDIKNVKKYCNKVFCETGKELLK